ncbi:MAG TPA: hypothetical protein PKB09_03440 [Candidatus Saccharibacteria bacterium]|nr:hypothetical protein [Candidatus Saccharibacteria bacterium]
MLTGIREGFEWPEAEEYAKQFSPRSGGANPATVAECVVSVLNDKLPIYDKSHRFYSPSLAIENGATTCKVRAYMAHLITSQVEGIRSAVCLEAFQGHAATYITDGVKSAVIDSTFGSDKYNSFYNLYRNEAHECIGDGDKMLKFFRDTSRTEGFAWTLEDAMNPSTPEGEATNASIAPLNQEIVNLDCMLMIGESATRAMGELLWAKQEMVDVIGRDLLDLLKDNTLFPRALSSRPQFC